MHTTLHNDTIIKDTITELYNYSTDASTLLHDYTDKIEPSHHYAIQLKAQYIFKMHQLRNYITEKYHYNIIYVSCYIDYRIESIKNNK
jgi:hypothetical protein